MKGFAAHYLYQGTGQVLKNHVLFMAPDGVVLSMKPLSDETASTIYLNGILLPAFRLSDDVPAVEDALDWLLECQTFHAEWNVFDCLNHVPSMPSLQCGCCQSVWCLEQLDLSALRLTGQTRLFEVCP
ncbi:MAG: hypothetical protein Q8914_08935 [Bacteroidota bacterium]|nr:hypothetical protein [Bacteroidota bacterium]